MNTTVLIPWDGRHEDWLRDCMNSFPNGTPVVVAQNSSKPEMTLALNEALSDIHTEFTFVCGADDLATPGMLEALEAAVGDSDGAYPLVELFGARAWTFQPPIWSPHIMQFRNICGVFLIRTALLRQVGGWRDSVVEDWDLVNRLAKAGARLERVMTAKYLYRQHDFSLSQRIESMSRLENFSQADQMKEILGDKLERTPLEAVFYGQASAAQNYVRGAVPAEHLPGVVSDLLWEHNLGADISVWLYPGTASYKQAYSRDEYGVRLVDVDDNYLSPRLIRELERAGRKKLAKQWMKEQPGHRLFVERADGIICATPYLAEVYADANSSVYVCRNGVLEADWRRVRKPQEDGKIRIGWAAGLQHAPDASIVSVALRNVKRRHPDVEVHVVGFDPRWDFDYSWEPFTPSLSVYRQRLASFDISIAPLKQTDMNRGKSDLKWLESSMAGAAFVCTDLDPYDTVEHGVTGLKCSTQGEWETYLEDLIEIPEYRLGFVDKARSEVMATRNALTLADTYRAAFNAVRALGVAA